MTQQGPSDPAAGKVSPDFHRQERAAEVVLQLGPETQDRPTMRPSTRTKTSHTRL
jgi:hypothetical protein